MENKNVCGIDLGTSYSCIGIWRGSNFEIIPDEHGNRTIPSVISYSSITRYIGSDAKNQMEINPDNTFYEIKRLMGKKYSDETIQKDKEFLTYKIDKDEEDNIIIKSNFGKTFKPEELSAIILTKLKQMANDYLKTEISDVVITVPAYFNDSQRQATKDAATISGLNCLRIINEPTSAALAYGLYDRSNTTTKNIIVYDIGGGTLDVSVLSISDGFFEVLACVGNTHLGGADFDNSLITFCLNYFKKQYKIESYEELNVVSLQKLRGACERAKIILSKNNEAIIGVKDFYQDKHLLVSLTREKLNSICSDLLLLCLKSLQDALISSDLEKHQIDEIILVGGMSRMCAIQENIKLFFGGKNPNSSVNPDEVVAMGAAIQGYILSHNDDPFAESISLLDIIPLSLGVETFGSIMNVIIPKNTIIPISKKKRYSTDQDYVDSVKIKVYEGERKITTNNFFVGEFILDGIELQPRGLPVIDVIFSVDANSIITVTAHEIVSATGEEATNKNKKSIIITGNKGRMKHDEIKKLIEEAKIYEQKDKIEKTKKKLFYEIDNICNNIIININNDEFKLNNEDKTKILKYAKEVLEWLNKKKYDERDDSEYINVINEIKKNHGILILCYSKTNDTNLKTTETNANCTSIYDDEEKVKTLLDNLEKEETGIINDEEFQELKKMKDNVCDLCNNIYEIISNNNLAIKELELENIRNLINDTLLYVYVHTKATIDDYKIKIDEINTACNKTFSDMSNQVISLKDELKHTCYTIKASIDNNKFSLDEENILILSNLVDDNLIFIGNEHSEDEYQERITKLNQFCNHLYENIMK